MLLMFHLSTSHFSPKPFHSNLWTQNTSKQNTAKTKQNPSTCPFCSPPPKLPLLSLCLNEIWFPKEPTLKFLTVEEGKLTFRSPTLAINHCSSTLEQKHPIPVEAKQWSYASLYGPLWHLLSCCIHHSFHSLIRLLILWCFWSPLWILYQHLASFMELGPLWPSSSLSVSPNFFYWAQFLTNYIMIHLFG